MGRKRKLTFEQMREFVQWYKTRDRRSMKYWSHKLGVSKQCLRDTLIRYGAVRTQPSDVARHKIYMRDLEDANQRAD